MYEVLEAKTESSNVETCADCGGGSIAVFTAVPYQQAAYPHDLGSAPHSKERRLFASVLRPVDARRIAIGLCLQHDAALEVWRVRELVERREACHVVRRAERAHVARERLGVARDVHLVRVGVRVRGRDRGRVRVRAKVRARARARVGVRVQGRRRAMVRVTRCSPRARSSPRGRGWPRRAWLG